MSAKGQYGHGSMAGLDHVCLHAPINFIRTACPISIAPARGRSFSLLAVRARRVWNILENQALTSVLTVSPQPTGAGRAVSLISSLIHVRAPRSISV
jgi:hypothetical protein